MVGMIGVIAVAIVGIGAYASLSSSPQDMAMSDDFMADPTASGIENMAQNIAENTTESATQAIDAATSERQAPMDESEFATAEVDASMGVDMEIDPMDEDPLDVMDTMEARADVSEPGTFTDYSPEKLALASNGTVVLFFHADWCPSCRGLEDDINAKLDQIPANTHILQLDYDTETELKKKYGVIRQHTLVVVDADGTEVKKLTGLTNTLDQVVSQL